MMDQADIQRALDDLLRGRITVARVFNLGVSPATSTAVACIGMSSNSVVLTQAYSALAANSDIIRIVPARDTMTVTHTASGNTRTHRYVWFTGLAT